ncbi:glycoside hydrolase family 95 protein [Aspergillus undulatus]|uniref:glycoside hydrolase family 95 protein n=1 Tax=Aspergillus undulatus TaxID=1810928 RepID=UPI003CCDF5EF
MKPYNSHLTRARPLLFSLLISPTLAFPKFDASRHLWYTAPANPTNWEEGVLPIGNGQVAATIYGGLQDETLTINENSIWNGPLQDRTPQVAREMLLNGSISEAGDFAQREMMHSVDTMRGFSYFGDLEVKFGHGGGEDGVEGYRRWLDTRRGDVGVEYVVGGVKYTREYIASFPAGVLAARFAASEQGGLSLDTTFSRASNVTAQKASADEGPIVFSGQASFVAEGAQIVVTNGSLSISNATTIDVFFDAETNYRYTSQDEIDTEINRKLKNALSKGFDEIKREVLEDSASLLGRASLNLGNSSSEFQDLPTDERIALARSGLEDPELATLAWNYGHLEHQTTAAWGGKYTININTEMNYWPAGPTNLIETQEPLLDLFGVAYLRGIKLARDMYGCEGVVFHHNLELWGDPAPVDNYTSASMWPMGAAWIATHLIDHYRFTGDKKLLSETVYPYLIDVVKFYRCYTFDYEGYRITGPSVSPENTFVIPDSWIDPGSSAAMDLGISMDDQITWEVTNNLLEAASELGLDGTDPDVSAAQSFLDKIHPPRIGAAGQIQEWRLDYEEAAPGHRHLSPLFGLHPGTQFSPLTNTTLSSAAEKLLDKRLEDGSGSTGWSNAWFINQYARLGRGEDAWAQLEKWFSLYPLRNLWNTDDGAMFQIDGNLGVTGGITEMLLQSHMGIVHILPALPGDSVPEGYARG